MYQSGFDYVNDTFLTIMINGIILVILIPSCEDHYLKDGESKWHFHEV
jgi:hypothetical protein